MFFIFLVSFIIICFFIQHFIRITRKKTIANNTILITGSSNGLGQALALQCASKQTKLILVDISDDMIQAQLSQINNAGSQAYFFKCDISKQDECLNLIQKINHLKIKVDILINNAGIGLFKLFTDESMEEVERTNAINYLAPVLFMKQLKNLKHIVNICSACSVVPGMKISAYSASKHQLWGYHNCLRMELKLLQSTTKTTLIAPWGINTGMINGLKTKLDFFFPIMDAEYVAKQIINAIEEGREIVFIPWYQNYISHLQRLLPPNLVDKLIIYVQARDMHKFVGRQQKQ